MRKRDDPANPPYCPNRHIGALGEGVLATIRTARGLAASQRRVELAGLTDMVGILCAKTLDLALHAGRELKALLRRIDTEIALLELEITSP